MKRVIAWVVIGSLLSPGVAWAQVSAPADQWSAVTCSGYGVVRVPVTAETWATMTRTDQTVMCVTHAVLEPPITYRAPVVSRKLAIAGMITTTLGVVWLLPQGENYSVLGNQYCVGSNYVDAGSCQMPFGSAKIPLVMIGAGAVMMLIGLQKKGK